MALTKIDHRIIGPGSNNQVLTTDGSGNVVWAAPAAGGISNVVEDTTPQLGGNLDVNSFDIVGSPAAAVGAGGGIDVFAAAGGITSGDGGDLRLYAGDAATDGSGGDTTVSAGAGIGAGSVGGQLYLYAQTGTTTAGNVHIQPGRATTGNVPGDILLETSVGATDTSILRFQELTGNGSEFIGFRAPTAITTSVTYTLPVAPAADNYILQSTTAGVLSWVAAAAGVFATSGTGNIYGGVNALDALTSGTHNFAAGDEALTGVTIGSYNIGIGYNSVKNLTSGSGNIGVGYATVGGLSSNSMTTATSNTCMGYEAGGLLEGTSSTGGNRNTLLGHTAGRTVSTGSDNTFVGYQTGRQAVTITGDYNTLVGSTAGTLMSSIANQNTLLGALTGAEILNGDANVCIGYGAGPSTAGDFSNELYINNAESDTPLIHGYFNAHASGPAVTINGDLTVTGSVIGGGAFTYGDAPDHNLYTSGAGTTAANLAAGGQYNFLGGHNTAPQLTTGDNNVFVGKDLGNQSTAQTGSNNTVVGYLSGQGLTSGAQNVMLGTQAGNSITTGSNNIIIGRFGPNTNRDNELFIGISTGSSDPGLIEGEFGKPGDARTGRVDFNASKVSQNSLDAPVSEITYILGNTTNSTTETELFIDYTGVADRMAVPTNAFWKFEVDIVAIGTTSQQFSASYKLTGALTNDGGTTSQNGTTAKVTDYEYSPGLYNWDCRVQVDNTLDALRVYVTAPNTTALQWGAVARIIQITSA